jgi:hypothetical protein
MKPLTESQIQKKCVEWFRKNYPAIERGFGSFANGGKRNAWTAKILKDEGLRAGFPDLILLLPHGGYASLCIEMKKPGGKQSEEQMEFERYAKKTMNKYVVCHSFDEFVKEVEEYLK